MIEEEAEHVSVGLLGNLLLGLPLLGELLSLLVHELAGIDEPLHVVALIAQPPWLICLGVALEQLVLGLLGLRFGGNERLLDRSSSRATSTRR